MIIRTCALLILLIGLSSCSTANCTRFENLLGAEKNLITFSHTIAEDLVSSALPPLAPRNPNKPIMTTTFVDNNDLQQTSTFGRLIQEHSTSRLAQLGYTVQELKFRNNLLIEPTSGETILSRHLQNLKGGHKAQAVMVGTISHTGRTMYISARLINPTNSNIISSQDYKLCMDDAVLEMFGLQRGTAECKDCVDPPSQPFLNNIFY